MSPYVRKVKTASGATAVQIAETVQGRRRIVEHLGSAHTEAELAALIVVAKGKIEAGQHQLETASLGVVDFGSVSLSLRSTSHGER